MSDYVMQMRKLIGTRPLIVPGSTVLVFNDSGELLLQHRSDTEEWGLPGGAMEPGESLEETAARELLRKRVCGRRDSRSSTNCPGRNFISNTRTAMKCTT